MNLFSHSKNNSHANDSELPQWAQNFEKKFFRNFDLNKPWRTKALLQGITLLSQGNAPTHRLSVEGQPYDSHLLEVSPLYLRSRKLYLKFGGKFIATYSSNFRKMTSPLLLVPEIEYMPVTRELEWIASAPNKNNAHLTETLKAITNVFHEQNHRILWNIYPSPPKNLEGYHKYLNFAESLVIAADFALAHQISKKFGFFLSQAGINYQTGGGREFLLKSKQEYRTYLQAIAYATYLHLCLYPKKEAVKAISILFPTLQKEASKLVSRAYKLDKNFGGQTNLEWQKQFRKQTLLALSQPQREVLNLPNNPLDYAVAKEISENWLKMLGL